MSLSSTIRLGIKRYLPFLFHVFNFFVRFKYKNQSINNIFSSIYVKNSWKDDHSLSGQGSNDLQTAELVKELPLFFEKYSIKTMLDIPCGDFYWMKKAIGGLDKYYGADIVEDIVSINNERFRSEMVSFSVKNIVEDDLGAVDLVFTRDCFVHFSYEYIFKALENIKNSKAKYLAVTTFNKKKKNFDIQTGGWRPINFQIAPFNFPEPLHLINEKCTEGKSFSDKSIAIWKISDL